MTKREMYTAVIEGKVTDEVIEGFKGLIADLDKSNANRKAKKNAEQTELDSKVLAVMTTTYEKAADIAKRTDFVTQKVVPSLKRLANEGKVVIKMETHGSRNVGWYALAPTDNEE